MKEIGKLLELLNEYETKRKDRDWRFQRTYKFVTNTIRRTHTNLDSGWDTDSNNTNREIVSKSYGFIKWLAEQDKIDKKKLDEAERRPMYVTDDMFSLYKVDECVIMLLSISDTPIEDLISYLR